MTPKPNHPVLAETPYKSSGRNIAAKIVEALSYILLLIFGLGTILLFSTNLFLPGIFPALSNMFSSPALNVIIWLLSILSLGIGLERIAHIGTLENEIRWLWSAHRDGVGERQQVLEYIRKIQIDNSAIRGSYIVAFYGKFYGSF